jgi:acyl-ACP thioesterase
MDAPVPPLHQFTLPLDVTTADCQAGFTASIPAILRWLQEAAGRHAERLGVGLQALQQQGLTWMLGRMSLTLFRSPAWQESLRLITWPSGIKGRLVAERQFVLETTAGEILLQASSEWLCVNLEAGRLAPLPDGVKALAHPNTQSFNLCHGKLPAPSADQSPLATATFGVRRQEIDANHHVNNVHYTKWMQETLPEALFFHQTPTAFDIEFKRSATLGDSVVSTTTALDDHTFYHAIRLPDGSLLARAIAHYPTPRD